MIEQILIISEVCWVKQGSYRMEWPNKGHRCGPRWSWIWSTPASCCFH